jgi:MFS family permease
MSILDHSLIRTFRDLKGNSRGVVYTEALWGIPFNLYAPYVSVYMLGLGLHDSQIGLLASISLALQVFWSMISGALTDKFGRKATTLYSDLFCWSIPCVIWAVSQNFYFFLVAAVINSSWRISHTSWTCLVVEDTEPDELYDVYTWIYIAGLLAAFFAPLAGFMIAKNSLIPTVRVLYVLAFILMTSKFIIMNGMVTETRRGKIRMAETKNQSLFSLLGGYSGVLRQILNTPETVYTVGIMVSLAIVNTINSSFWAILVTRKLLIPEQHLAIFPVVRSIVMLLFFFFVTPYVRRLNFRTPMLIGLGGLMISQLILITAFPQSYGLLIVSVIFDACSLAMVNVQVDRMFAVNVNEAERARIISITLMVVVLITSPFGWIAGRMSEINRVLPFLFNILLFAIAMVLVWQADRIAQRKLAANGLEG